MRKRLLPLILGFAVMTAIALPAQAGGWASVTLLDEVSPAYQEVPWTIRFLIKQHDVQPVNVDRAYLSAQHRETGESIQADAVWAGDIGTYAVTAVFPLAGEWKWSITPEPFEGNSFATLTVLASANDPGASTNMTGFSAQIRTGSCAALGDILFPLDIVAAGSGSGVTSSTASIATSLTALTGNDAVIDVTYGGTTSVACGEITGQPSDGQLAVALRPVNDSAVHGVAVLRDEGEQTVVTLYLLEPMLTDATATAVTKSTVEVLAIGDGGESWQFTPGRVEITVGMTVVWTNATNVIHNVSAPNLAFEDSGYIAPGESYRQTFTEAGTYVYRCDPHPWMTGIIEVT